jgi:arabinogalactan endo-1,4-beta-galactosidase
MDIFKMLFKKTETVEESNAVIIEKVINSKWDEVYYAWASNDLQKMLNVVNNKTCFINRHFLLQEIVIKSYKLRKQEYYKNLCLKYSETHLNEFSVIAPFLKEFMNGKLPRIVTFQNYATLLTEIGEYEKAILICEIAISYELNDGTKSNYQGRIARIKKKHKKT